jgi:hypothetical protein
MSASREDGPSTRLAFRAALGLLDDIDRGLDGLRREPEWADKPDAQAAFDAVERLLVAVQRLIIDKDMAPDEPPEPPPRRKGRKGGKS